LAHEPSLLVKPLTHGFSPHGFSLFIFCHFLTFSIYLILPHLGCWRKGV
jgi:hypothetical protein